MIKRTVHIAMEECCGRISLVLLCFIRLELKFMTLAELPSDNLYSGTKLEATELNQRLQAQLQVAILRPMFSSMLYCFLLNAF